jgi:filamentous hemagglutinin family protein
MTQSDRTYPLKLISKLFVSGLLVAISGNSAFAQIESDRSLGSESSEVIPLPNQPIDAILGGAKRGSNLFHSFREFNVSEGRGAYFLQPVGVENILIRVTGTNPSNILGTLGVAGNANANLFFINPNGIIFGSNASLDIQGSFVATTANAIGFGDRGFFSASEPNAPTLLTVNPSAFLFDQIARERASIENNSIASAGLDPSGQSQAFGLRVADGQSLLLLGGDINLNAGSLNAFGGRVELGAINGEGTVRLNTEGNNFGLSFPDNVARADVSLTNGARVNVSAGGGGSIAIDARNFEISGQSGLGGQSGLRAGIMQGLGSTRAQAGDITIQATENVTIQGGTFAGSFPSFIFNEVSFGGVGNAGDIIINARSLSLIDAALVSSTTFGQGEGGNLIVNATDSVRLVTSLVGGPVSNALFSQTGSSGKGGDLRIDTKNLIVRDGADISSTTFGQGAGGNLRIDTKNLIVRDGAVITSDTAGQGAGGNLTVNATESIQLIGTSVNGFVSSSLLSETESSGDAGNLRIDTKNLIVRNGAVISSGTTSQGGGGNLTVNATDSIQLTGTSTNGFVSSALFSQTENSGDAGNLTIDTRNLIVRDGAQVRSGTTSQGGGGSLTVNATDSIQLIGTSAVSQTPSYLTFPSGLLSLAQSPGSTGRAGDLRIDTKNLIVRDGAQISSGTLGQGAGGILTVNAADSIRLLGESANGVTVSSLFTETRSTGRAGDLRIDTKNLIVRDGAQISSGTLGQGAGGILTVNVTDSVRLIGRSTDDRTGLFSSASNDGGEAGNINMTSRSLFVTNNASISVDSQGTKPGGNINIETNIFNGDRGTISAETANNDGGDINLNVQDLLLLRNGSQISTTAGSDRTGGNGGNIEIDTLFLIAVPLENSDITANAFEGRGGNINVTTQGLFGIEFRESQTNFSDITASSELGLQGTVEIDNPNTDPSRTIVNLPVQPAEAQVLQACQPSNNQEQSEFVVTGRGGLPPTPQEELGTDSTGIDWVSLKPDLASQGNTEQTQENLSNPPSIETNNTTTSRQIVEAQGMVVGSNGKIVLTAQNSGAPEFTPNSCKSSQNN